MKFSSLAMISAVTLTTSAHALVDYSESTSTQTVSTSSAAPQRSFQPARQSQAGAPSRSSGAAPSGMFQMGVSMESLSVEQETGESKVTFANVNGKFETPYNMYLDVDYYMAKSNSDSLSPNESGYQKGNPRALVGFHWLNFGDRYNRTTVDFYAGASFGVSDSAFATTRTDKIFGLETIKMMGAMGLGLGYELNMTGTPDNETETSIGNIHRIKGALGLTISGDIQFQLEAAYVRITGGDETKPVYLQEQVSYGELVPRLLLGMTPSIQLELGGRFRTKRQKDTDSLVGANLWRERGVLGNSIHAGLQMAL